ncbi:MAG: thioredoxin family protein [Bacteroidota bacterium]
MVLLDYLGMNLGRFKYRTYLGEEATDIVSSANGRLVVIAFSAIWTGHGQIIDNFYEELSEQYGEVLFLRVDVEQSEGYAQKYGIRKVPTTLFLEDGQIVDHFEGLLPKKSIVERINALIKPKA